MAVTMTREQRTIPTYEPAPPNSLPFFLEKKAYQGATGKVYPLPYTDRLSNTRINKDYDMIILENEYIQVELLPELGGKIHGAVQKSNGYEFIYKNICIKPAMVGLAGPWVSGGVEFNWPQHHRPTTFMPTEATLQENSDGSKTCWMGEADPFYRMRSAVGITVYPGSSLVEAKAVVYNRTDTPLPFMWWNNLAVRVHKDYKATFPPDVEWVNDHDRRAVISFPVMKGVFHTARPYDYGEGTDATWFSNIKLPTSVMVMRGQSNMDFLGGYDFAANAGTVTVSDHHYSVGKKMWTWGDGDFGRAWCSNLTDNGDRYIELMTGVFTDNQPDFTYIMPGEMKTFTTVWYPVREIGPVMNASREGAISLTVDKGQMRVGAIPTFSCDAARLSISVKGTLVHQEIANTDPDHPLCVELPLPDEAQETDIEIIFSDQCGHTLVSYRPPVRGNKPAPKPRSVPPVPQNVASLEELYLHGAHLEQYKHHTYVPEDYYMEALRRDPEDLRCNHAMGRLMIAKGDFAAARVYLERAVQRLKMRNDNPADPEPIYHLARLERIEGNLDKAYDLFADASWQFGWRSPCLYEMACIDCIRGNKAAAITHLLQALETNVHHFAARTLLGYLTGEKAQIEKVVELSPQDTFARFALWLMGGEPVSDFILSRPQDVRDAADDFLRAGLKEEALQVLHSCTKADQIIRYLIAFASGEKPEHGSILYCFPNRLEDILLLQHFPQDWEAQYLLGCVYYDRLNYGAALACWRKSARLNPDYAFTWRNMAQALFDHFDQKEEARSALENALRLAPDNARIVYELLQLYKNIQMPVEDRLVFLENHEELVRQRDDCFLEMIILYVQQGSFEHARKLLLSKRFNIYEGGEGKLTRLHGWLYTLWGEKARTLGDSEQAARWFEEALHYPANYGEGRHYSAQEANIYYYTGLLHASNGNMDLACQAWEKAATQPNQITEITYFAALSEAKLGHTDKAQAMFHEMIASGIERLETANQYGYFGVGMEAPLPFEINVTPIHQAEAYLLLALGYKGLGEEKTAESWKNKLVELDPWNSKLCYFHQLSIL